jgi:hypothetical protein
MMTGGLGAAAAGTPVTVGIEAVTAAAEGLGTAGRIVTKTVTGAASSYIGTVAKGALYGQSLYADAGMIAGALSAGVTGAVGEAFSIGFAGDAAATKFLSGAGKLVTAGYGEAAKYGVYAGYSLAEGRKKVACTETYSMWW